MSLTRKNVAVLGSTGSIGQSSLEVLKNLSDRFRVTYLSANKNVDLLGQQIAQFRPRGVVVFDEPSAATLRSRQNGALEIFTGEPGLLEIVRRDDVDIVLCALVGFAGLTPTIEAIKHRKTIALANKETLVVAGVLMKSLADEFGVRIIPIDSEHSAILQCLLGEDASRISRLILTASGGPFLNTRAESLTDVTVEQALNHPNWKMGKKITIDSATLMNKGLEVIEAHWLFDLPPERIEVVIHPQSIIHSMVEFVDGSIKAQLGIPDMKLPIQFALTYPERSPMNGSRLDFPKLQLMTFFQPDKKKFRCLQLAYDALAAGGTAATALNAANEVAVEAFLGKKISFQNIPELIDRALSSHRVIAAPELPDIIEADRATRTLVRTFV